jgi:hypothetical protein
VSEVRLELLYFDGCPHYEALVPVLAALAADCGAELRLRRIDSARAAEEERFLGSPSVRVDGVDVDPEAGDRTDFGLQCRVYQSEQGQSREPPVRWIRAALEDRCGLSREA